MGGFANLKVGGGILGAILFSTGLLTICLNGYQLTTGQFGGVYSGELRIRDILLMLVINICGAVAVGLLFQEESARNIAVLRIAEPWFIHVLKGAFCGICIQIAVQNFKKGSEIGVILPVLTFMLAGGQHCIADSFYFASAGIIAVLPIFWVFVGNFIGASLVLLCNESKLPHFRL